MDFTLDVATLLVPAFVAGIVTFFAPCTLPLVPGYLAFIGGTSARELGSTSAADARRRVVLNGLAYVVGFSAVFILLGSLFGLGGAALVQYRLWLARIGGVFVIVFGLVLTGALRRFAVFRFLEQERHPFAVTSLTPGTPTSSFIFGATFAFGWTPCIGPILGSVLLLASTSTTLSSGALLLAVFSLGLALPFLAMAFAIGTATRNIAFITRFAEPATKIGGLFLIGIGVLLVTNNFGVWIGFVYRTFRFINYEALLNYL